MLCFILRSCNGTRGNKRARVIVLIRVCYRGEREVGRVNKWEAVSFSGGLMLSAAEPVNDWRSQSRPYGLFDGLACGCCNQ